MRIQHNIAALNSHRQLTSNNSAVAKNLEKLSSGYKINRAGDDAAGLAISEKMRAQITGLETAQKNAQDGISLVQTAEGALTEVHSMLNRMVELADQSANGTYDDSVDRANLQKELVSLRSEIDRIAEGTNFNGINLLDGNLGGPKMKVTAGEAAVAGGATQTGALPAVTNTTNTYGSINEGDGSGAMANFKLDISGMDIKKPTDTSTGAKAEISILGNKYELDVTADMDDAAIATALKAKIDAAGGVKHTNAGNDITFTAALNGTEFTFTTTDDFATDIAGAPGVSITGKEGTIAGAAGSNGSATSVEMDFDGRTGADILGGTMKIGNTTYSFIEAGGTAAAGTTGITITKDDTATDLATKIAAGIAAPAGFTATATNSKVTITEDADGNGDFAGTAAPSVAFDGVGLTLQIGDTADSFNQLTVSVSSMSASSLGLDTIDISTQAGAKAAIDKIKTAINTVSSTRGDLGAIQNRLEHTINNLSVTTENMTAAESRIRDVDMAEEMMAYTKNNILVQASQAMLAQANQLPQGVLQLLQ